MAELTRVIPDNMRGWIPWAAWTPPPVLIQVSAEAFDGEPILTCFPAEFNFAPEEFRQKLYWRLTGIAKQRIENLDPMEVL